MFLSTSVSFGRMRVFWMAVLEREARSDTRWWARGLVAGNTARALSTCRGKWTAVQEALCRCGLLVRLSVHHYIVRAAPNSSGMKQHDSCFPWDFSESKIYISCGSPRNKAFKTNKSPICCCPSEFSSLFSFACARSEGPLRWGRCIWQAPAGLLRHSRLSKSFLLAA